MANTDQQSLLTAPSATLQSNINPQNQCLLFSLLPAEIRSLIFTYTLTDYEDTTHKSYDRHTYWYRPGYKATRRTATELLRSCKRIFQETWFMPFALAEHSFYLTADNRAPPKHINAVRMKRYLDTLRQFARNQDGMDIPQIHSIRFFAQLWVLEEAKRLPQVLSLEGFQPRNVTITIRYTDFWHWENNTPLRIDARWVNTVKFPESVTSISMDFETVDRRKKEVDALTDMAAEKWVFRRADGLVFKASKEDIVTSGWTGSSTWRGDRWLRDESRINEIDFYVKTVTWKVVSEYGPDDPMAKNYTCPNLHLPAGFIQEPVELHGVGPRIPVAALTSAGVPSDASAEEAAEAVIRHVASTIPRARLRVHQ